MDVTIAGGGQNKDGYSYLCRLEELRQWMAKLLDGELPKATELETRLMNGVLLVKLGKILLPDDPMWRKAYDLDEKRYLARGAPDFRHTDNINFFLQALGKIGLPNVFYPVTIDIYEAKNLPKLIFCLHALSHYSARHGQVSASVPNLEGRAKFTEKEIAEATDKVAAVDIPSFEAVGDLVDEEMQYQAMGEFVSPQQLSELRKQHLAEKEAHIAATEDLYDAVATNSVERDIPPVPERKTGASEKAAVAPLAAADTYDTSDNVKDQIENERNIDDDDEEAPPLPPKQDPVVEVSCSGEGITVSLYAAVDKAALLEARRDGKTPQEHAIAAINKALTDRDLPELMKALRNSDADLPDVFSEPGEYMKDLVAESKSIIPQNFTPVFTGISRDQAEELLSTLSPGAVLVRSGTKDQVVSFRNRTGIKHWQIGISSDGKYFFGASPRYENIGDFMVNFMSSLSNSTGLRCYYANDQDLKPKADDQERIYSLGPDNPPIALEREYIEQVVAEVNKRIRSKLLNLMGDGAAPSQSNAAAEPAAPAPPPQVPQSRRPTLHKQASVKKATADLVWSENLLTRVGREPAEKILMDHGKPGNYLVRISDRGAGQFSITFRLSNAIRHWKVVHENGRFSIPPNSPKVATLPELVAIFQKVEHEPGVRMVPILPSAPGKPAPNAAASTPPPALPADPPASIAPAPASAPPPALPADPPASSGPVPPARRNSQSALPTPGGDQLSPRKMSIRRKPDAGVAASEWDVAHVERWLMGVGLGMHVAVFKENYIDGQCLLELTDSQLKNDMGITALGHRNQILRKIKVLSAE